MIFTSNYAYTRKIPNTVAISRGVPNGFPGEEIIELAPATWEMIRMKDWEKFKPLFKAQLAKLDVHEYAKKCEGKILLCWEAKGKDCHRILVREWFKENGYECEEFLKESDNLFKKKKEKPLQEKLI